MSSWFSAWRRSSESGSWIVHLRVRCQRSHLPFTNPWKHGLALMLTWWLPLYPHIVNLPPTPGECRCSWSLWLTKENQEACMWDSVKARSMHSRKSVSLERAMLLQRAFQPPVHPALDVRRKLSFSEIWLRSVLTGKLLSPQKLPSPAKLVMPQNAKVSLHLAFPFWSVSGVLSQDCSSPGVSFSKPSIPHQSACIWLSVTMQQRVLNSVWPHSNSCCVLIVLGLVMK